MNPMQNQIRSGAAAETEASPPWWRLPIVWMVIGGPAAVVVAGFATLAIAITHPDPVLSATPAHSKAELPAVQGRNHAATPGN